MQGGPATGRSGVAISTLHLAPTCGVHLCLHHRHSIIRPWLSFCLLALVAEPPLLRSSTPSHHIFQLISTIHGFLSLSSVSPISVQFMKQERLQIAQNNGNLTATCANSAIPDAPRVSDNNNKKQQQQSPLRCPRCDSANTKFCYFNNYSLSQPRHFCKACKRYWTRGGSLRNVPVGGGCRKNKRAVRKLPPPPRSHLLQPPPAQPRLEDAASALYAMSAFTSSSSSSLPISILSADLLLHLKLAEAQPFPAAGSDAVRVTDDYTNPLFGCSSYLPTCDQDYDELAALQLSFGELEAIKMMKEINWQEYQINNNYYKNDNSSDCNIAWQMSQSENSLDHNLGLNLLNANAGRLPESYSTNLNNFGSIAPPI